jgi:AhpD family alkylhydroperoxidase
MLMWPLFKKYQIGESVIPQKYREMMMLAASTAVKCPYCQIYHKEVSKMMWGATEEELNELAAIVARLHFGVMCYIHKTMTLTHLSRNYSR